MADTFAYSLLEKLGFPLFKPKFNKVTGTENLPATGAYVLAPNHVDYLDGFYIGAAIGLATKRQVMFLTETNYWWWTTAAIQIPKNKADIVNVAADHLRRGKIICNFPEGQRNATNQLLPGKTGTIRMAVAAGVPVVPVGIACPAGKNMGQSLQFAITRNKFVTINIGQPINLTPPGEVTREWLEEQTDNLMRAIAPLCNKVIDAGKSNPPHPNNQHLSTNSY